MIKTQFMRECWLWLAFLGSLPWLVAVVARANYARASPFGVWAHQRD